MREEGAETERSEHPPGGEEGDAAEGGAEGGTEDQPPTDGATAAEGPTELPVLILVNYFVQILIPFGYWLKIRNFQHLALLCYVI